MFWLGFFVATLLIAVVIVVSYFVLKKKLDKDVKNIDFTIDSKKVVKK